MSNEHHFDGLALVRADGAIEGRNHELAHFQLGALGRFPSFSFVFLFLFHFFTFPCFVIPSQLLQLFHFQCILFFHVFPGFFVEIVENVEIDFENAFIFDFKVSQFLFIEKRRAEIDFLKRIDGELAIDTIDIHIDGHWIE